MGTVVLVLFTVSTMGWELRVFCPAETAKHVLAEDKFNEKREDEYMVVSSRVGLKKRNSRGLWEVKTKCGESKECPGLELWCKDSGDSIASVQSIIKRRGVLGEEELSHMERRIQVMVEKQRQTGWSRGVLIEQTDLVAKVAGKTEMWRCVY